MKILFFLALLVNLIFFLWQYNAGAYYHPDTEQEINNPDPKQIVLVSELEKSQTQNQKVIHQPNTMIFNAPAAVVRRAEKNNPQRLVTSTILPTTNAPTVTFTATKPKTDAEKSAHCYQVTGFVDKATITEWAKQQNFNHAFLKITEIPAVFLDYQLYYPATVTEVQTQQNSLNLKQHGISDFFVIEKGDFKGAISLGVFKKETQALQAQQKFLQKGVSAQIGKRYKTAATISAQIKSEKNKSQLLATLTQYAPKPSVELSSCE